MSDDDDVLNKISHLQAAIRQLADQGKIKPETKKKLFHHLGLEEGGESASADEGLLTAITYLKDGAIGRYRKAPNVILEDGDEFVFRNDIPQGWKCYRNEDEPVFYADEPESCPFCDIEVAPEKEKTHKRIGEEA